MYVKQLATVPKDALDAAGTKIVVIGCGEWNPIQFYSGAAFLTLSRPVTDCFSTETTEFHGEIYADPTRELYRTLGMNIETTKTTPAGQQKRSYITMGMFSNVLLSTWVS